MMLNWAGLVPAQFRFRVGNYGAEWPGGGRVLDDTTLVLKLRDALLVSERVLQPDLSPQCPLDALYLPLLAVHQAPLGARASCQSFGESPLCCLGAAYSNLMAYSVIPV